MALTQSMMGATVRKLVVSSTAPPASGREALAGGDEDGDVGAAEPVDRLLGVAHDEQAAGGDVDLGPLRRRRPPSGRRRRCARRARSGSGRCPGTRRAAGAGSARGAPPARPAPAPGRAAPGGPARAGRGTRGVPAAAALVGGRERGGAQGGAEAVGAAVEHAAADGLDRLARRWRAGRGRRPCRRCHDAALPLFFRYLGMAAERLEQVEVVGAGAGERLGEGGERRGPTAGACRWGRCTRR